MSPATRSLDAAGGGGDPRRLVGPDLAGVEPHHDGRRHRDRVGARAVLVPERHVGERRERHALLGDLLLRPVRVGPAVQRQHRGAVDVLDVGEGPHVVRAVGDVAGRTGLLRRRAGGRVRAGGRAGRRAGHRDGGRRARGRRRRTRRAAGPRRRPGPRGRGRGPGGWWCEGAPVHLPPKAVPVSIPAQAASRPTSARADGPARGEEPAEAAERAAVEQLGRRRQPAERGEVPRRVAGGERRVARGRRPTPSARSASCWRSSTEPGSRSAHGVERHVGGEVVPAVGHRRRHPAVPEPGERSVRADGHRPRGRSRPRAPGPPRRRPARPGRATAPRARSPPRPGRPARRAGHHRLRPRGVGRGGRGPEPLVARRVDQHLAQEPVVVDLQHRARLHVEQLPPDQQGRPGRRPPPRRSTRTRCGQPSGRRREVDPEQLQSGVRPQRHRRAARRRPRPRRRRPCTRPTAPAARPRRPGARPAADRRGAEVPARARRRRR